jgi:hypothetical protein
LVDDNQPKGTGGRLLAAQGEERSCARRGAIELMPVKRLDPKRPLELLETLELPWPVRPNEEVETALCHH